MPTEPRLCQSWADKPDVRCAALARRQHGVLSLDDLKACGLSRENVRARVAAGHLHPLHRGVYAWGHTALTREAGFLAAVKTCGPDAVLSHTAAAALWGLLPFDDEHWLPEVTTPRRAEHEGIITHTSHTIERVHRLGIAVTPPLRTIIDLAATLPLKRLERAVNEALNKRLIGLHELVIPSRRGARKLRRALADAAPTRNEFEDLVLHLIAQGGLPRPDVNQPLDGYTPASGGPTGS